MISYPVDEPRLAEVERGRCSRAILPLPPGESLAIGDTILFALAQAQPGREPIFVKGGDSVVVLLAEVNDLGRIDPVTGHALYELSWEPLGRVEASGSPAKRVRRSPGARGST